LKDKELYTRKKPGAFFNVEGMNPDIQAVFPHHHQKFYEDGQSNLIAEKVFFNRLNWPH